MKKTYYFPNDDRFDEFFSSGDYICVDYAELENLARGWEISMDEMMDQVHEASESEIAEYGTYDAE